MPGPPFLRGLHLTMSLLCRLLSRWYVVTNLYKQVLDLVVVIRVQGVAMRLQLSFLLWIVGMVKGFSDYALPRTTNLVTVGSQCVSLTH